MRRRNTTCSGSRDLFRKAYWACSGLLGAISLIVASQANAELAPPVILSWTNSENNLELYFRAEPGFAYGVEQRIQWTNQWHLSQTYPATNSLSTNTYQIGVANTPLSIFRIYRTLDGGRYVHYMSPFIDEIQSHAFSDEPAIEGRTTVVTYNLGDVTRGIPEWTVGNFTGFFPQGMVVDFQRAVDGSSAGYGSTAVQMQGTTTAFHINSYRAPAGLPPRKMAGLQYAWSTNSAKASCPWNAELFGESATLRFDYEAAVPTSSTQEGSTNSSCLSLLIVNRINQTQVWLTMGLYDSRGRSAFNEGVHWNEGADSPTIASYYGGTRYSTTLPGSSESDVLPWAEWRTFSHIVSRSQLQQALSDINEEFGIQFSTDPDLYQLRQFAISAELVAPTGMNGLLAMKVRNIEIHTGVE